MLVSYDLLKKHFILTETPQEIADILTVTGIETTVFKKSNSFSDVVVGKVTAKVKHETSDKLNICQVDIGDELLQIICGASNVDVGQYVPVAKIGAVLPGNFEIKEATIRGIDSFGMICSATELGLTEKKLSDHEKNGILVLSEDAVSGTPLDQYFGLAGEFLELEITANREDCKTFVGFLYELGAVLNKEFKLPSNIKEVENNFLELVYDKKTFSDFGDTSTEFKTIHLREGFLEKIIGFKIDKSEVLDLFSRLKFKTRYDNSNFTVEVPKRRTDISVEIDLVEEIVRLFNVNDVPLSSMKTQTFGKLTKNQKNIRKIKEKLTTLGVNEVLTYSLVSKKDNILFSQKPQVELNSPMSENHSCLRTSIIPSLLSTASYNYNRDNKNIKFFEIGNIYQTHTTNNNLPHENITLSGIFINNDKLQSFNMINNPETFFEAKHVLESLFISLGIKDVKFTKMESTGFHKNKLATILIDNKECGTLGEIDPRLADEYNLIKPVVFELDLTALLLHIPQTINFKQISKHPSISRDLSIVVNEDIVVQDIEEGIYLAGGEFLNKIILFDVFAGEQLGVGKKGVSYSLNYQASNRTLTDAEVTEMHNKVISNLEEKLGAELRC